MTVSVDLMIHILLFYVSTPNFVFIVYGCVSGRYILFYLHCCNLVVLHLVIYHAALILIIAFIF